MPVFLFPLSLPGCPSHHSCPRWAFKIGTKGSCVIVALCVLAHLGYINIPLVFVFYVFYYLPSHRYFAIGWLMDDWWMRDAQLPCLDSVWQSNGDAESFFPSASVFKKVPNKVLQISDSAKLYWHSSLFANSIQICVVSGICLSERISSILPISQMYVYILHPMSAVSFCGSIYMVICPSLYFWYVNILGSSVICNDYLTLVQEGQKNDLIFKDNSH